MDAEPVIAACGAVTALGLGLEPLARALRENASGLRAGPRGAAPRHQSSVVGCVPDPVLETLQDGRSDHAEATAFLLAASALAQVDGGAGPWLAAVPPTRRGLVLSTTKADVAALERGVKALPVSNVARRHILPGLLATDLAEAHSVRGPVECVSVACVSGLLALQHGARAIQCGLADAVFVVGVDLVTDFVLSGFTALKSLDPEGCRPFDRARAGLSLGEGAGAVLLTRPALAPGAAVRVAGWGSSNDANHLTGPSRDGSGLALAIRRALETARMAASAVDYVNAHGTGTLYNDAMEALALRGVFGERVPAVSSSKGLLGHTLGAAGVLETIVCVIAAQQGFLPGTPRLRERDPAVPESVLAGPQLGVTPLRMLKINAGFGGANAALILERRAP